MSWEEMRGSRQNENDVSEVIPGKEPDVDGLLPALLEVVRCVFKCFLFCCALG